MAICFSNIGVGIPPGSLAFVGGSVGSLTDEV